MKPPIINNENAYAPIRHQVYDIFPTPLVRGELNLDHNHVTNTCREILADIKKKEDDPQRNYTTYFFEEHRQAMIDLPWYEAFANQLKDTYVQFISQQWYRQVSHLNRHDIHLFAWVSDYAEGQHHSLHNHQNTVMSGTYYPRAIGDVAPIHFQSPHIQSQFIHSYESERLGMDMPKSFASGTPSSHQSISIYPTTGEVLIWPSNLLHGVDGLGHGWSPEEDSEFERVAISFNLRHDEPVEWTKQGTELSYEFL